MHGNLTHHDEDSSSDAESTTPVHLARKKRKPLMEKKRRARINASLEQLKKLVLDAMKKDSARYSKLEKADILELTVRHLREGQQQQMNVAMTHDTSVASKYKAGFVECASEVGRYLSSVDGLGHEVTLRLMQHLSKCVQRADTPLLAAPPPAAYSPPHYPLQIQIPSATTSSSLPGSPPNLPPTPPSSADHSFSSSSSSSSSSSFQFSESTSPVQHQQQHHFASSSNNNSNNSMLQQNPQLCSKVPVSVSQAYICQQIAPPPPPRVEVHPLKSRDLNIKAMPNCNSTTPSSTTCSSLSDLHASKRSSVRRYSPYPVPAGNTTTSSVHMIAARMKRSNKAIHTHQQQQQRIVVKEENMWRPW